MTTPFQGFVLASALAMTQIGCFGSSTTPGNTLDASTSEESSVPEDSAAPEAAVVDQGAPAPEAAPASDDASSSVPEAGTAGEGGAPAVDGGTTTAILVPALGSGFDYHQGSYALGWYFVANAAIQVTSLGFYDDMMNGLTESHPVAIYDKATQAQLAMATVSPSDPLTGYFRFTALSTPLTLVSGKEYVVLAWVGSENYLAFNTLDPGWTVAPAITYEGSAVNYANAMATTLIYPDTFTPNGGDFGPNFLFQGP